MHFKTKRAIITAKIVLIRSEKNRTLVVPLMGAKSPGVNIYVIYVGMFLGRMMLNVKINNAKPSPINEKASCLIFSKKFALSRKAAIKTPPTTPMRMPIICT